MSIKNLSQLKKALASGHNFRILAHYKHPEWSGQIRTVKEMGTTIMYTGLLGHPESRIDSFNDGKGCYFNFGKASDWTFRNGQCKCKNVWTIEVM